MTSVPDFLSLATTLVVLGLIVAAVMKVFQIGAHVEEMKEILKEIRRGANGIALPSPAVEPARYPAAQPFTEQPYPSSDGVRALAAALPQPEGAPSPVPGAPVPGAPVPAAPVPAAPVPAPAAPASQPLSVGPGMNFSRPPTPEELVRAIHEQDFRGDDFPL